MAAAPGGPSFAGRSSPPAWKESSKCYKCSQEFTLFKRRHHCRNCGESFCDKCTWRKLLLPHIGFASSPVRVCDACFGRLRPTERAPASASTSASTHPQQQQQQQQQQRQQQQQPKTVTTTSQPKTQAKPQTQPKPKPKPAAKAENADKASPVMLKLQHACIKGNVELVTQILQQNKPNVNAMPGKDMNLLFYARKHPKVVELLLQNGANPHILCGKANKGHILGYACRDGITATVKLLLEKKVDINQEDPVTGWSPLARAIVNKRWDTAMVLLDFGADHKFTSKAGKNMAALSITQEGCDIRVARRLLEFGNNPNDRDNSLITPFYHVCRYGRLDLLKLLLEFGGRADSFCSAWGIGPLYISYLYGNREIARFLVSEQRVVNAYRGSLLWERLTLNNIGAKSTFATQEFWQGTWYMSCTFPLSMTGHYFLCEFGEDAVTAVPADYELPRCSPASMLRSLSPKSIQHTMDKELKFQHTLEIEEDEKSAPAMMVTGKVILVPSTDTATITLLVRSNSVHGIVDFSECKVQLPEYKSLADGVSSFFSDISFDDKTDAPRLRPTRLTGYGLRVGIVKEMTDTQRERRERSLRVFDGTMKVREALELAAQQLGRDSSAVESYIKKMEDAWYSDVNSLENVTEEVWKSWEFPPRLLEEVYKVINPLESLWLVLRPCSNCGKSPMFGTMYLGTDYDVTDYSTRLRCCQDCYSASAVPRHLVAAHTPVVDSARATLEVIAAFMGSTLQNAMNEKDTGDDANENVAKFIRDQLQNGLMRIGYVEFEMGIDASDVKILHEQIIAVLKDELERRMELIEMQRKDNARIEAEQKAEEAAAAAVAKAKQQRTGKPTQSQPKPQQKPKPKPAARAAAKPKPSQTIARNIANAVKKQAIEHAKSQAKHQLATNGLHVARQLLHGIGHVAKLFF
jgi:ankyrin repeat protein